MAGTQIFFHFLLGGDRPVYYGAMDVSLSSLGEAEARAAALYLEYYDLDIVVSSPLSRAIFGAEQIVAFQKNLPKNDESGVVKMDGFKELDRGSWCGMTKVCLALIVLFGSNWLTAHNLLLIHRG